MVTIRSITPAQAAVIVACLAAMFASYRFLGPEAAGATALVSTVINAMLTRVDATAPPVAPLPAPKDGGQ